MKAWNFPLICLIALISMSGATAKELEVGDRFTDFELPIVGEDDYLTLSDEFKQGPVVVVVLRGYPGYQCPVCTTQVASFRNRAKAIGKLAHRVVLVYPGEADTLEKNAKRFLGSRRLPEPFVLVRDEGMKMVEQWGIRWDARRETAYPSTFVFDRHGRLQWKKVSKSHAGRSTVEEVVKALREI